MKMRVRFPLEETEKLGKGEEGRAGGGEGKRKEKQFPSSHSQKRKQKSG